MGIFSCCKSKKKVDYHTLSLVKKINDLTKIIGLQTDSIRTRDNDIKKLKEALKERALCLKIADPWSAQPALLSNSSKGSGQAQALPKQQSQRRHSV